MLTKKQLAKYFGDPSRYTNELIQDQLERAEVKFNELIEEDRKLDALAIYQEYAEWIESEEGETYGFIIMDRIANY